MQSPIHAVHQQLGARFVDFSGWEMPVQYTSVLDEHMAVRRSHGWFDVSHLGRFSLGGPGAAEVIGRLLSNDAVGLEAGRSQYTLMLNDAGGIIDDLIVWKWGDADYWVLPNAANHERVMERFRRAADGVEMEDLRPSTVSLAVQGPEAPALIETILGFAPARFRTAVGSFEDQPVWTAGTGYTGERGGEIVVPVESAAALAAALVDRGSTPCGLAARDTLRLEAGLPLWGQDMDESTTPLETGLGFAVDFDHDFVGRAALRTQQESGPDRSMVTFKTEGRQIPRHGMRLRSGAGEGHVTSGNFSPVLECGIGMGLVTGPVAEALEVEIRGRWVAVERVKPPFHRARSTG